MTDLLYQTDSYLREFAATVVAVDAASNRVALDRSAFYPGGGGQPNDTGTLTVDGADVRLGRRRVQQRREAELVRLSTRLRHGPPTGHDAQQDHDLK